MNIKHLAYLLAFSNIRRPRILHSNILFMFPDIVCFCHLRWDFVYQRPQHLLSRFAQQGRVFIIEEPFFDAAPGGCHYEVTKDPVLDLWIVQPHVEPQLPDDQYMATFQFLLNNLMESHYITQYIAWYYSPMAFSFSAHLRPLVTVYDCMDELSAFLHAPASLKEQEKRLLQRADIVFTGGQSLYEAKKHLHANIHPFPSSIDKDHFSIARTLIEEPEDQAVIPHPRIGFYGVIDERLHISLLGKLAQRRPAWQFIIVGPVVKIDPASLPRYNNLHYLGGKSYTELPAYLAGWDIAMLPFMHNEATRFISPTKTPEYLAGGKPVISTSVKDVVDTYEALGLVKIADTADTFIAAADSILADTDRSAWLAQTDAFLATISWDKTWENMNDLILMQLNDNNIIYTEKMEAYV